VGLRAIASSQAAGEESHQALLWVSGGPSLRGAQFELVPGIDGVRITDVTAVPALDEALFAWRGSANGGAKLALAAAADLREGDWLRLTYAVVPGASAPSSVTSPSAEDAVLLSFVHARVNEQPVTGAQALRRSQTSTPARLWALEQNTPNPFNPRTTIRLVVPGHDGETIVVRLEIFDTAGRKVRVLASGPMPTGEHDIVWDGRDDHGATVGSGVYLLRLESAQFTAQRKMVLLR